MDLSLRCWFCFTDSQGNNGRPGKPGDRGAPGPQVTDFRLNKETQTDIRTVNMIFFFQGISNFLFAFVLNCRVLVDSPEPLDFQEWRDTEWALTFFLSWPELCLYGPHLKHNGFLQMLQIRQNCCRRAPCWACKMWTKWFEAFSAAPPGLTVDLPLFLSQIKNKRTLMGLI